MKTARLHRTVEDPRDLPAYSIPEAAHYLSLPVATLRAWVSDRSYPTKACQQRAQPVIRIPQVAPSTLSFFNLCEAHVLAAIRREHHVALRNVRRTVVFLCKTFDSRHPLLDEAMETEGKGHFIRHMGGLNNITQEGQRAIREMLDVHLKRIERDAHGLPIRLYPFTRSDIQGAPRSVVIEPGLAFGRPVIAGTNIPTSIVAERCKAGETISQLAEDYGRSTGEIEEAIRCELERKAA
ncbi:MAG: hypothetical protein A2Y95_07620 [Deltaproteobacteria bacterium RBG_13_65_10]|nr:MAG: hypothetical protein A2Y95_07620 [Deltaproteobacteria bacterium RBG_13_65_10]